MPPRPLHDRPLRVLALAAVAGLLLVASPASASLIAAWGFDDGTADDSSGSPIAYDLGAVNGGPDLTLGFARFDGLEASPSFLEVGGPGGMPDWTVSLWVRSQGALDQGLFQGLMSNNSAATANFSWQIESHGGLYQWRTRSGTFVIGAPSALDAWDHVVIRKFGGNDGDLWLNGVQVGGNIGVNPGGLQNFRLGTNRNSDNFWQGDLDDVLVYDSVEDPATLFASPPAQVPEARLASLCGLIAIAWLLRAREHSD